MPQLALFNDEDGPPVMTENAPSDPVVWIRRFRIVTKLASDAEDIRDITFRRGMNIVCTAERPADEERTVGHSVGKTLLLRMIRYCLGERAYCKTHTREAIAATTLSHAYAMAEVIVQGASWVVARPIGLDSSRISSFAAKGNNFDVLYSEGEGRLQFTDFERVLDEATTSSFRGVTLPYAKRPIQWIDLLAWLSRDQGCRYRSHTEWRIKATEHAGSSLRPEDTHILIRTALGLILPDEMELVLKHKQLERDRGSASVQFENMKRILEHLQAELTRSLKLPGNLLGDKAFAGSAADEARGKCESLKKLLDEMEADNPADKAEQEYQSVHDEYVRIERDLSSVQNTRALAETQLRQLREANTDEEVLTIAKLGERWCDFFLTEEEARTRGCPASSVPRADGICDPHRAARVARLEKEIESLDRQIVPLVSEADQVSAKANDAAARLRASRQNHDSAKDKLRRRLGFYLALADRASQYRKSCDTLCQMESHRDSLESQLAESLKQRQEVRLLVRNARLSLSDVFDRTLKQMLGDSVGGRIDIDSNGIFPRPTAETRANGDAMSTSATVLGFDIACLIASVGGTGLLPRFWLHDSPREADMETPMFHRVFRPIAELESQFQGKEPSFQYIMTTTTRPPKYLDTTTHVRLELDAREPSGLLLKQRF